MTEPLHNLESITSTLEDEIVFGRLSPLQELIEDALIERFAAKRHVVRAAISTLVDMGLVTKPPHKTARVKELSPQEVEWVYQIRMLLSGQAVESIMLPASAAVISELREIQEGYRQAIGQGQPRQVRMWNDRFHECLFGLAPNPLLVDEVRRYTKMTDPIRSTGIVNPQWTAQALQEHDQMIHALETQDRKRLKKLALDHMVPVRDEWLARRRARVID